jgi:hypothetical protein
VDIVQPAVDSRPTRDDFRARNDEPFFRRKEFQERQTVLRAKAGTGASDMLAELASRRAEREFENLTYEIMVANYGLVRQPDPAPQEEQPPPPRDLNGVRPGPLK